ncbi:MAG: methyltransferase [Candidatus Marithrix sp.]
MNRKQHWEQVYNTKSVQEVSWYQNSPTISLNLIAKTGYDITCPIIDVGGGASNLVDSLLEQGYSNLSVLDISSAAIKNTQQRLGKLVNNVHWYAENITQFQTDSKFDIWHDRAVFHFLTTGEDRKSYLNTLDSQLSENGKVIIATFSLEGPTKCSDLPIIQYDATKIQQEVQGILQLYHTVSEVHITPSQKQQQFKYFCFKRVK